jgi:hypothetical protein
MHRSSPQEELISIILNPPERQLAELSKSGYRVRWKVRQTLVMTLLMLVLTGSAFAQRGQPSQNSAPGSAEQAPGTANSGNDELARMRDDLNKLESLNLNMSSEIEFLRDQNLQILLRTNVQMWTIMIRDLREQVTREEQRQAVSPTTKPTR